MKNCNNLVLLCIMWLVIFSNPVYSLTLNPSANNSEDPYFTIENALNPPKPKKTVNLSNLKSIDLADCSHNVKHIIVDYDFEMKTKVFKFLSHKNDGDCISGEADYTKSRTEIKLPSGSPYAGILGYQVNYSWKFKLNDVSPTNTNYFHNFQLKARTSSSVIKPTDSVELGQFNDKLDPRVRFSLKDRSKPENEYNCNKLPLLTDLTKYDLTFTSTKDKNLNLWCEKNSVVNGSITWEVNAINDSRVFQSLYKEDISKINNQWFEVNVIAKFIDKDHGNFTFELKKWNKETQKFEHYHGFNTDLDLWGDVQPWGEWLEIYPKIGMYFEKGNNFNATDGFSDSSMSVYDIKFDRVKLTK